MPFILSDAGVRFHYMVYLPDALSTPTHSPVSPMKNINRLKYESSDSDSDDDEHSILVLPKADSPDYIDFSKPTVVLLHPPCFDAGIFCGQYHGPQFDGKYNLVGVDLHYHGGTKVEADDEPWDWNLVGSDMISAIRNLGIQKCHFLCASFSTHLAITMHSIAPELFKSMSFVGALSIDEPEESRAEHTHIRDACFEPQPGDDPTRFPSDIKSNMVWIFFGDDPSCYEYLGRWEKTTSLFPLDKRLFTKMYSAIIDRPPMPIEVLNAVTCPVLMIHGSQDAFCPLPEARKVFGALESASTKRLEVVDEAPHCLFLTHSDTVNQLVAQFLDEVEVQDG